MWWYTTGMELFSALPLWWQLSFLFGLGVIIGSFLNVVLYRLHTGKSLQGHSHCLSCGHRLSALELIPLISYLCLRGRCRACGSYIPVRYFAVELLTGLMFMAVYLGFRADLVLLVLGLVIVSLLVVVAVYDLRHFIIPDELVISLTVLALMASGYRVGIGTDDWSTVAFDLGAAVLGAAFFYLLWHVSKGTWIGFGDVKLAFPLGLIVGASGVFSLIVFSFWVGAIVGLVLLILQRLAQRGKFRLRFWRRQLTMKSAVPFAPFLICGFLLVWLWEMDAIALLTYGV